MKQQTAVEWLIQQRNKYGLIIMQDLEQALAMEKEQIMKAFSDGQETPLNHPTLPNYSRDEYYNETYKTT